MARGRSTPSVREDVLFRGLELALEQHTDLVAANARELAAAQDLAERCDERTRFSCWARSVKGCAMLLVLSASREESADYLSLLLIEQRTAEALDRAADRSRAGWEDRLEASIFEKSTSKSVVLGAEVSGSPERIAELVFGELQSAFESTKHRVRYGRIEVEAALPGISIDIDGANVGETVGAVTVVRNVRPGRHTVVFWDRNGRTPRVERSILVRENEAGTVSLVLAPEEPTLQWARPATFWGGIGIAAAGAGLSLLAVLVKPGPEVFDACIGAGCRERAGFASLCEITSGDVTCLQEGKGVLALPLGYSMILTGAIWAIGTEVDESRVPWLSLAVGVVAGALAYGVSALADDTGRLP